MLTRAYPATFRLEGTDSGTRVAMLIVAGIILDGIDPVGRILDERDGEEAPVVGLGGRVRPLQEDGRIGEVLVEQDGGVDAARFGGTCRG